MVTSSTKLISKGGLHLNVGKAGKPALTINVVAPTPPLVVNSSGRVENLNADLLDGVEASGFALSQHGHSFQNVVTVGNGDENYPTIQAALDSISDAADGNPYLMALSAGTHSIGSSDLAMKPWVSLAGQGRGVTVISGTSGAGVIAANNTTIRDLTIESSDGTATIALENTSTGVVVHDAVLIGSNGSGMNRGLYNHTSGEITLIDVDVEATGGTNTRAVDNNAATATVQGGRITAGNASSINVGVFQQSSGTITVIGSTVDAAGGNDAQTLRNDIGTMNIHGVTVTASGAAVTNYAVRNTNGPMTITGSRLSGVDAIYNTGAGDGITVDHSVIEASGYLVVGVTTGSVSFGSSRVDGGTSLTGTAEVTCVNSYNSDSVAVDTDCVVPGP